MYCIKCGVKLEDTEKVCRYLAEKALSLRVFEDENEEYSMLSGILRLNNDRRKYFA